jgi:hypothetical protein
MLLGRRTAVLCRAISGSRILRALILSIVYILSCFPQQFTPVGFLRSGLIGIMWTGSTGSTRLAAQERFDVPLDANGQLRDLGTAAKTGQGQVDEQVTLITYRQPSRV